LEACIERTPDILVEELRDELGRCCGTWTSHSTIIRTLQRLGWTRKKVRTAC
ncbi:hypothetical protein EXIGLDRAFT_590607, partial [Exidia glandulosa HHB12029]